MEYRKETKENAIKILNDGDFLDDIFVLGGGKKLKFIELTDIETKPKQTNLAVIMKSISLPPGEVSNLTMTYATMMMRWRDSEYYGIKDNKSEWGWVGLLPDMKGWIGSYMINLGLDPDKWYWLIVKDAN